MDTTMQLLALPYNRPMPVSWATKERGVRPLWTATISLCTSTSILRKKSLRLLTLYLWRNKNNKIIIIDTDASRGTGAQIVTVKSAGYRFDPHSRRWNICWNLYFHFFTLVSRQSAGLSSATQHAMPLQCRIRNVLAQGTLCLPCCERDTKWSLVTRQVIDFNSSAHHIVFWHCDTNFLCLLCSSWKLYKIKLFISKNHSFYNST